MKYTGSTCLGGWGKIIALAAALVGVSYAVQAEDSAAPYVSGTENPESTFVQELSEVPATMLDLGVTRLQNRVQQRLVKAGLFDKSSDTLTDVSVRGRTIVLEAITSSDAAQESECRLGWLRLRSFVAGFSEDYLANTHTPNACNRIASSFAPASGQYSAVMLNAMPQTDPCATMTIIVRVMGESGGFRFSCTGNFYSSEPQLRN